MVFMLQIPINTKERECGFRSRQATREGALPHSVRDQWSPPSQQMSLGDERGLNSGLSS